MGRGKHKNHLPTKVQVNVKLPNDRIEFIQEHLIPEFKSFNSYINYLVNQDLQKRYLKPLNQMLFKRLLNFTTIEEGEVNIVELERLQTNMIGQHMKDLVQLDIDKVREKINYITIDSLIHNENSPST